MADDTDDVINYLNAHHEAFWVPSYRTYTGNLYAEATTLHRQIRRDEWVARQSEFGA